jgi:hypothetical protein
MIKNVVIRAGENDMHMIVRVTEWMDLPKDEKLYTPNGYPKNKVEELAMVKLEVDENFNITVRVIKHRPGSRITVE